jgi:rSAM/selenodomain-associated transferase 1
VNLLCVLARVPQPGAGKTRLRAGLGHAATDRLASAFVVDVLGWGDEAGDALLVCPTGPFDLLPPTRGNRMMVPQVAGSLGDRIAAAVDTGFAAGASRVVIIGSDCPSLPAWLLERAFSGLDDAASTVIPAFDGGWIALGVDRPLGAVLAGVTWSSESTLSETVVALRAAGRPALMLPPWYDLDEPADLDRLSEDASAARRAPETWAALAALRAPVR